MGSLESPPSVGNGFANHVSTGASAGEKIQIAGDGIQSQRTETTTLETDASKKRKASVLPLEVGTRVLCRWRDGKYHPVKVIERRKVQSSGLNDYEYYVHYTECKIITTCYRLKSIKSRVRFLVILLLL